MERATIEERRLSDSVKQFFYITLSPAYVCCFVMRKTFRRNSAVTIAVGCRSAVRRQSTLTDKCETGCYTSKSLHGGIEISEREKERRERAVAVPSKLFILAYPFFFFSDELSSCKLRLARLFIQALAVDGNI